jgi:hypothetical protein
VLVVKQLGHFSLAWWLFNEDSKWRHGPIRLLISVNRNLVELVPLPRFSTYYHHFKPPRFNKMTKVFADQRSDSVIG